MTVVDQTRSQATQTVQTATSTLLARVEAILDKYVVLPGDPEKTAITLYTAHTWAIDAASATPYLVVASAEKGCGKTRLLETLELLVRRPWHTASTTEAALFRKIDAEHPTLLLDEIDTIFSGKATHEALRGVLNAGNRRGSSVTRCEGRTDTKEYSTYCAKVLAGIDTGYLPATIVDRSIVIRMVKRSGGDAVARMRIIDAQREVHPVQWGLETWGEAVAQLLHQATPELPVELGDRAGEAWEPLLAIADLAGEEWADRARRAAIALNGTPQEPPQERSLAVRLLEGIREAMGGREEIDAPALVALLEGNPNLPFKDEPLGEATLAGLLAPFGVWPLEGVYTARALRRVWECHLTEKEV